VKGGGDVDHTVSYHRIDSDKQVEALAADDVDRNQHMLV
jgi:hypothetical protein